MRRQPARLLRVGAAEADQLAGDLRAGAERADADIGARQLLGDDAHRELAEAEPAIFLGHGQAEDAERRQLLDDRAAGSARPRRCQSWANGATLLGAKRRNWSRTMSSDSSPSARSPKSPPSAHRSSSSPSRARAASVLPAATSCRDLAVAEGASSSSPRPRSCGPRDLDLAHARCRRRAARDIRRTPICRISASISPSSPSCVEPLRPVPHLAQRLDIGRHPGIAMRRELLALRAAPDRSCRPAPDRPAAGAWPRRAGSRPRRARGRSAARRSGGADPMRRLLSGGSNSSLTSSPLPLREREGPGAQRREGRGVCWPHRLRLRKPASPAIVRDRALSRKGRGLARAPPSLKPAPPPRGCACPDASPGPARPCCRACARCATSSYGRAGMSFQAKTSDMQGSMRRSTTRRLAWLACSRLAKWLPWMRFCRIHTKRASKVML